MKTTKLLVAVGGAGDIIERIFQPCGGQGRLV